MSLLILFLVSLGMIGFGTLMCAAEVMSDTGGGSATGKTGVVLFLSGAAGVVASAIWLVVRIVT